MNRARCKASREHVIATGCCLQCIHFFVVFYHDTANKDCGKLFNRKYSFSRFIHHHFTGIHMVMRAKSKLVKRESNDKV